MASNLESLHRASRSVCSQVRHTAWPHLLRELAGFERAPIRQLRRIQKQLREGSYRFSPKRGYAKRKSGGSRRGITVHNINDRIVQRALLNAMHSPAVKTQALLGAIPQFLRRATSFAGTPGRGVPEAIDLARRTIRRGARAYAYSDMKDFFPRVPRKDVVDLVRENVEDSAFVDLFAAALETEIENHAEMEAWLALFPLSQVGVSQGSLLSTLAGNLALRDFDAQLNDDRYTMIRYLDDFLILAADLDTVAAGFSEAVEHLSRLGMECYQPGDGSHKAALGLVVDGFDFLGCRVHPSGISPSRKARQKLLRDIASMIATAKSEIVCYRQAGARRRTESAFAQTLVHIDRKIRGWGDAYRFVSNRVAFAQIDVQIDRMLNGFQYWFHHHERGATDDRARRRMRGIALLADTPPTDSNHDWRVGGDYAWANGSKSG